MLSFDRLQGQVMKRLSVLVALALVVLPLTLSRSSSQLIRQTGIFSRDAVSIWGQLGRRGKLEILSPDKRKSIVAEYSVKPGPISMYSVEVHVFSAGKRFETYIGYLVNAEVAWVPDSKAFFVTYSDGGNVGTYHTNVYYAEETGLRIEEPASGVLEDFLSEPVVCAIPEDPNIGAITWLGSSSKLLVAAEILPHSNCDSFGTFKAYEIGLPQGKILKRYGQIEAKRLFWEHLGPELRNAPDECVLNPKSCEIPSNHPK